MVVAERMAAGKRRVAPVTAPTCRTQVPQQAAARRRLRQASQLPMRSATNTVATTASARSTHTAAMNSAAAGNALDQVENRAVTLPASRTAVERADKAHRVEVVAVVKVDSPVERVRAVARAVADRAAADPAVAFRAWVDPN